MAAPPEAMSRRERHGWLALWIGALALIAQTLLPLAQAEAMRLRGGSALAYVVCGHDSAALRQAWQSLASQDRQAPTEPSLAFKPLCSLCGHHIPQAAGLPQLRLIWLSAQAPSHGAILLPRAPSVRQLVLPPLRAPPRPL